MSVCVGTSLCEVATLNCVSENMRVCEGPVFVYSAVCE